MRMYRVLNFIKLTALTASAMAAGAGCCCRIMAQPEPYIMPVETVPYDIETASAEIVTHAAPTEPLEHDCDTIWAIMTFTQESGIAPEQLYDIPLSDELQHGVFALAKKYELSYELVLAVIMTESSGRPDTSGDNGDAIGLMQIQPKWYGELISETGLNVDEPIENVELGIIILLGFLKENDGSIDRALKQYNSGNPDYEGNEYIERVHEWLDYFEKEAAG